MIALVTDSASMLPPAWRERDDVHVVPMTIVLDGEPAREGIDLGSEEFYRRLADGATVSTSAPSPGEVLVAYREAIDTGAGEIVSIHTGADYSAVGNAARIAAREVACPVEIIDTATASFPVALCVAAAADAARAGADADGVAAAARSTAAVVDSIFIVGVPELARRGGRLPVGVHLDTAMTLLTLGPGGLAEHGTATGLTDALTQMAEHLRHAAEGSALRVGVGDAHRPGVGDHLAALVDGADGIVELTRYEIGPSVGAHSGAGTVGAVWSPI